MRCVLEGQRHCGNAILHALLYALLHVRPTHVLNVQSLSLQNNPGQQIRMSLTSSGDQQTSKYE